MNRVIEQTVKFKWTTAAELFDIFLDPLKHSQLHGGAKAEISNKEGEISSLINGNLNGKNILIVPSRMIVQTWRGNVWKDDDLDSVLTMVFSDTRAWRTNLF